jgi:hypothetical protein
MTKKLLVLLIAAIPMLTPNLASAIAIDPCYLEPDSVCQPC